MVRTGATFEDAAAEWLRYCEHDRAVSRRRSPATGASSASAHPAFGEQRHRELHAGDRSSAGRAGSTSRKRQPTRTKATSSLLHAIFKRAMKVYGLPRNPVADVETPARGAQRRHRRLQPRGGHGARRAAASRPGRRALPHRRLHRPPPRRAARAALGGRRLRRGRRSASGANWTDGREGTPKSGRDRAVPMVHDVAAALARLGQRDRWHRRRRSRLLRPARPLTSTTRPSAAATRRRSTAAGLRQLRFHDLRHTFGTHAIASRHPRVMEWMGHADIQTTRSTSPTSPAGTPPSDSPPPSTLSARASQRASPRLRPKRRARWRCS